MLTLTFLAAIVIGPEITSVPYTPAVQQLDCPAATLSLAGSATFLAWPRLDGSRAGISAVLLDSNFHEIAGTHLFFNLPTHPACVASASDGQTVILTWTRPLSATTSAVEAARFTTANQLIEGPMTLNDAAPVLTRPAIAWDITAGFLILAGQRRLELTSGAPLTSARAFGLDPWVGTLSGTWWRAYDAIAPAGGSFIATARAQSAGSPGTSPFPCPPRSLCLNPTPPTVSLGVERPYFFPMTQIYSVRTPDAPGVTTAACVRTDCLVAWNESGGAGRWLTRGDRVNLGWTGTNLASASDDERIVIAGNDPTSILVTVVAPGAIGQNLMLARGRRPAVLRLGNGRFLVAYEIVDGELSRRLGGRVIEIDPPARRRISR